MLELFSQVLERFSDEWIRNAHTVLLSHGYLQPGDAEEDQVKKLKALGRTGPQQRKGNICTELVHDPLCSFVYQTARGFFPECLWGPRLPTTKEAQIFGTPAVFFLFLMFIFGLSLRISKVNFIGHFFRYLEG